MKEKEQVNWEELGLLEGLNENEKKELSDHFDEAYSRLNINGKIPFPNAEEFAGVIFVLLRRVYSQLEDKSKFDFEFIWNEVKKYFENGQAKQWAIDNDLYQYWNIDWEAEYIVLKSDMIVQQLNDSS